MRSPVPPATVTFRPTCPEDTPRLPAIERSADGAFASIPELAWLAGDDDVLPVERHLEFVAGGTSWVAVDAEGAPVAFLAAEQQDDVLHVWELAVRLDLQGRGIGRALVPLAVAEARERRLRRVTLTTFLDVHWNEPFYRSLGFRRLDDHEITDRLRRILADEARQGLPLERRCAMIHPLDEPGVR